VSIHSVATTDIQDPTFNLARLVINQNDPWAVLKSRSAQIADEKVFNIDLKGTDDKNKYPGPVTDQGGSGRCWLFATSESRIRVAAVPCRSSVNRTVDHTLWIAPGVSSAAVESPQSWIATRQRPHQSCGPAPPPLIIARFTRYTISH